MSAPSDLCEIRNNLQLPDKEDKSATDPDLENKSINDVPSPRFDNITDVLDSIKDSMMCAEEDDAMDYFLLSDNPDEEKVSLANDQEQLPGSQGSSGSDDLYLVLSDEGEADNQTDTEKKLDEETDSVDLNDKEDTVKEQSENIDTTGTQEGTSKQVPVEETLSCDLHVSENHNTSECSTDSSDLLKLTSEEEKICPSTNDNILDEDECFQAEQESKEVNGGMNSSDANENVPVERQKLKEQTVESSAADESSAKDPYTCQDLQDVAERPKEKHAVENLEGLSKSNSSGSTELESRYVTETALNKNQAATYSGISSPSVEQPQLIPEKPPASKNETVAEVGDTETHVTVDISSTLPCGLFKDDSLEEFSLSPKDGQTLNSSGKNNGIEVNGLSEPDQGMSIEDIIDNLSSPIGDDASSVVDESASGTGEAETTTGVSSSNDTRSNKRPPDPDNLSNDKVEVKKVKLDIVFSEKTSDTNPENSDQTKNVASSTVSVEEEKENIDVNGDFTKMDIVCDDDIDIIEEKYSEKKEENPDEKTVVPDVVKNEVPALNDETSEVKVNGISTDHSDEDIKDEKVHLTEENIDELVIKRISDKLYEDHINTIVALMKKVETLEKNLEKSKKRLSYYQSMLGNLSTEHRRQLAKLGYLPKVHTRTVGVNVRILQEHELQSTNRLRMVKDGLVPPTTSATPSPSAPVLTNTNMQLAQAAAKKCLLPRASTPGNLMSGPRMPSPNVTVSQITVNPAGVGNDDKLRAPSSMQIIPNASQGMTSPPSMMNRPRMQPSILRRQPVPKSPGSVPSTASIVLLSNPAPNTSTVASSSINVIDLTEDGDSSLTTTTAATSQSSAMLVSPSATRGPSGNLVPMPLVGSLNSVVQIIPSGPHMSSSMSGGNAIRVGRPPTVLPNSTCLPQGPRVAYLLQQNPGTIVMPRMDGQVSQIGNLQPHQSPFVTSSGQHVPTILVRMNAPPSNPAPVVSSNAVSTTKPTISQSNAPVSLPSGNTSSSTMLIPCLTKHPAPLPPAPSYPENKNWKCLPPKPALKISKVSNGIVLSWNMSLFNSHAEIATYQLFAYQESNQAVTSSLWKKVGDVKALPLPMACTLTQFVEGHKYHFAVRAVDIHGRIGPFSDPSSIVLLPRSGQISSK